MDNKKLVVRDLTLGEGLPKICVPVVGKTKADIINQVEESVESKADMIEFRADFYEDVLDEGKLFDMLKTIRAMIGNIALIFTIRTADEGGELKISSEDYIRINGFVCDKNLADIVDVEAYFGIEARINLVEKANKNNVHIIMSNHDFNATPAKDEIRNRLEFMEWNKADIAKIAVMPNSEEDVQTLLLAIKETSKSSSIPVVGISMGELGKISRVIGEEIGSAITFGVAKYSSAPGQIEVSALREMMKKNSKD